MPHSSAKHWFLAQGLALTAALWLGLFPGTAPCRADSPVHYFAGKTFEIPVDMDANLSIRQILLHASSDGKNYTHVATAGAGDKKFVYTGKEDGWYYFVVQVEYVDGRLAPANVSLSPPGLRVCVDTVKPVAMLKAVAPQDGGTVAVEWQVSDTNLDLRTLKMQYAPQGIDRWVTLNIRQMEHAQFSWSPTGAGPFDVRMQVADLAGNLATATARVVPGVGAPIGNGMSATPSTARVIHVRSKTFKLNFKLDNVGPSNVKHVEVWMTRNDKKAWTRFLDNVPPNGPCELTVPQTGRYGFTLRPVSGVGRGPKPPSLGQEPQIWIEVDEKLPVVVLHNVIVGEGPDNGFIIVNWRATDDHFRSHPITIKYATSAGGPWTDLQANLENTGTCKCSVKEIPANLFEFYVRVEAYDEAGNMGFAQTKETVKVDLNVPQAKEIEVDGVASPAKQPGG